MKPAAFALFAEALNALCKRFKVPLTLELFTPARCREILQKNEALLQKYGRSQFMYGDKNNVEDGHGRPFIKELVPRIKEGRWKWYFGIISRCSNGAVIDGVTRLIAISHTDISCWALVYSSADESDFSMYDAIASARTIPDEIVNRGTGRGKELWKSRVLSIMLPKLAGGLASSEEGRYERGVLRDEYLAFADEHKDALNIAVDFVKQEEKDPKLIRRNLLATMYFKYVSGPDAIEPNKAERFLTVYKTGYAEQGNSVELQMCNLKNFFTQNQRVLKEQTHLIPHFCKVMDAALAGKVLKYRLASTTQVNGQKNYTIEYANEGLQKGRPRKTKLVEV